MKAKSCKVRLTIPMRISKKAIGLQGRKGMCSIKAVTRRALAGRSLRIALAASVLSGGFACGGGVFLGTDADVYVAGEPIELILRNYGVVGIGFNLCVSRLERQEGASFESVKVRPSDAVCTADMKGLWPGRTAAFLFSETAELAAGEYRFSTRIEVRGNDQRIYTEMFEIRPE